MTTIFLNNTYKSICCTLVLLFSITASQTLSAATLATGGYHTCMVKNDGTLACWGLNDDGRATSPSGTFSQLSVGWDHACALRTDASLICWGRNESGQPAPVVGSFSQISAGYDYTCALKTDATLACWGDNLMIPPTGTFTQISTGWYHACGIKTDGTLACWGKNDYQPATPPEGTFLQVTANGYHSCGIKTDSTVVCWGNTSRNQASPPAGAFTQIVAGFWYTCGIKTDGTLACWGDNDYGQAMPPAGSFLQVSAGYQHACGVRTDGTVTCWGDNSKGQATPPFEVTSNCTYHLEPASYFHAAAASKGMVTVTASAAECPWTVSSQVDWVTITSGNVGRGNGAVTYAVATNASEQNRGGMLLIADQPFAVSQWTATTTPVDTQNAFSMPVAMEAIKTVSQNLSVQTPPQEFRSQTFPITLPNNIYGLSITGQFGLRLGAVEDDPAAFVRVVLVDNNTQSEYLVYEKSLQSLTTEEYNSPRPLKIEKVCEESCVLPQPLNSFSLRLEVRHGALSIGEVSYVETPVAEDTEELRAKQNAVKIWQLNEQDLGWIAGETAVSNLSYAEKKRLLGSIEDHGEFNLQGLEYYRGGIFGIVSKSASTRSRIRQARDSSLVENFNWADKHHGKDCWVTPVKFQPCGNCWTFSTAGALEAVTSLYFNQCLNLDLAEQDTLSCSGAGSCNGGVAGGAFDYFQKTGIVDEACFPNSGTDQDCRNKCSNPQELIQLSGRIPIDSPEFPRTEDAIKRLLIENGPITASVKSLGHAMNLVGFKKDPFDGRTIWIFKNSWGKNWGAKPGGLDYGSEWGEYWKEGYAEGGYVYIKLNINNFSGNTNVIKTPIISKVQPRQISCVDQDNDTYCNWGISKDKPSTCPASCKPEKDCDDSNPDLAVFDANYNCTGKPQPQPPIAMFTANPLKGVMPLKVTFDASGSSDPDGTIAIYEWTIDGQPAGIGNPFTYTFDKPGQFEVSLTVTDQQGLTATFKKMVTVVGQYPPVAKFSISPNYVGNAPLTVGLNAKDSYDLDGKIVRYQWQSSAGHTSSDKNVQMTFNTAGSYTITLTVTDDSNLTGQAQREVIVTVNDVPAPTDCSQVTQIPPQECQALLALYHSTNGPNWKKNDNWNKTNMPCNWYGVGCKKGHVGTLYLTDNNLVGTLPPELNVLSTVTIFWFKLCGNQLSGSLPDLSALSVEWFCLNNNQLSGHITTQLPKSIGNLSLDNNQFTGPLPESIGNVFAMLSFSNNHFCGEVPRSVMKRTFRPEIGLSNNHLIASDPEVAAFLDKTMPGWEKTQTPGGDCAVSNCTYTITPTTTSHSLLPETGTLTVTAPENCSWTATSNNDEWITITSGKSGQGNGTVTYSVRGNSPVGLLCISPAPPECFIKSKSRSGTLTIAEQTITVNQLGEADCTYTITPTTAVHGNHSETGTLTITAPAGCDWYANSETQWITITSKDSGQGNGTVTYSVAGNINAGCISPCSPIQSRSGTISVAGQTVTVTQNVTDVQAVGIITTVAGDGTEGFGGDGGPATSARLNYPLGVAVDSMGNLYIADAENYRIRKVDAAGIISTVAGNGTEGFSGDGGVATDAQLNGPSDVSVDSRGNFYIADVLDNRIRKVNTTGIITTVAGNGMAGFSGDGGPATDAQLSSPTGVTVDSKGNLYIAEYFNYRIRKVDTAGIIFTVVGNGTGGFSGDSGVATSAQLNNPGDIAFDNSNNLYITDSHRIRKVDTAGIISTVAGNGTEGFSGDGGVATDAQLNGPSGVGVDSRGNLYIADVWDNRIRKVNTTGIISTVAGNGTWGYSGDGGVATSAQLNGPGGVAVDNNDNLYIADSNNNRIRKVTFNNSTQPKVEIANPLVSQAIYQTGETLRVTLPSLPAGQEQYVGIASPDGSINLLNQLGSSIPFDNVTFPVWSGGEVAIEKLVTADQPSGLYTVYLLRMPTGVSPSSVKMEDWALGSAVFTVASANTPIVSCDGIIGKWQWFNDTISTFYSNGTSSASHGYQGTWQPGYVVTWHRDDDQTTWVDTLTLSSDGQTLDGQNQNGNHVWGTRLSCSTD